MKKFTVALLVAAMACSLIGCGKKEESFTAAFDEAYEKKEEESPTAAFEEEREETQPFVDKDGDGWNDLLAEEAVATDPSSVELEEQEPDAEMIFKDPVLHYEGHEEDILWGGNFVLSYTEKDEETGMYMAMDMEFSNGDDYFATHMYGSGIDLTMAGVGDDFYLATADGAYRVTDDAAGLDMAEEMGASDNLLIDFSTLKYINPVTASDDATDCYAYALEATDGTVLVVLVNRETFEIVEVQIAETDGEPAVIYSAWELTERSFDPADYGTIEDVSADDAARILMGGTSGE